MAEQSFTNLDFQNVKDNLKNYLKGQSQFQDYDFEGANINVLLDVLAYNTFQNNFYTNMAISEMFLDSAQLKDSVVSHAKELNYLPRSRKSARAEVTLQFFPINTPSTITIPEQTEFTARCGTQIFKFWTDRAHVVRPSNGVYEITGLDVYEGKYVEEFYTVDGTETQKFLINNPTVDTDSIRVYIRENSSETTETEYTYKPDIYNVNSTDTVFYLQAFRDNRYEITFGNDVFGKSLANGNIVRIEYRTTVGDDANGINTITLTRNIDNISVTTTLTQSSQGGAERESLESIKYFAPKSIQVQNRAVTENDYAVLLRTEFPEILSVSVYGGEQLVPPQFGRVVIAAYVNDEENIADAVKQKYIDYLSDKTAVTVEPIIIPAKFMFVDIQTNVYYNTNATSLTQANINSAVTSAITTYSAANLEQFKRNLRYSKLSTAIDASQTSILSNDTRLRGIIKIVPPRNTSSFYTLQFGNQLERDVTFVESQVNNYTPCITSDSFTYNGVTAYIIDNGAGRLDIVKSVDGEISYIQRGIGSVDYTTGDVTIRSITIQDYPTDHIKVYARFTNKDIIAPKDRILKIVNEDISVNVFARRQ